MQVADTLGVLQARFAALRLEGGGLHLSRRLRPHSQNISVKKASALLALP